MDGLLREPPTVIATRPARGSGRGSMESRVPAEPDVQAPHECTRDTGAAHGENSGPPSGVPAGWQPGPEARGRLNRVAGCRSGARSVSGRQPQTSPSADGALEDGGIDPAAEPPPSPGAAQEPTAFHDQRTPQHGHDRPSGDFPAFPRA